jgi:hypothetical protein
VFAVPPGRQVAWIQPGAGFAVCPRRDGHDEVVAARVSVAVTRWAECSERASDARLLLLGGPGPVAAGERQPVRRQRDFT